MSNKPLGLKVCSLEIGFGIPMAARQRFSWPTMSWTLLVEQVVKNSFQSDSVRLELDLHPTRLTFNFALVVFSAIVSFPINTFSIIKGVHRQGVSMYPAKQPIGSADSRRPRCCDVNNKVYKLLKNLARQGRHFVIIMKCLFMFVDFCILVICVFLKLYSISMNPYWYT